MKREDEKNRKGRTGESASRDALGLSGTRGENTFPERSLAFVPASRAMVRDGLRSQLFAQRLAAKYFEPFKSGVHDFLSKYFGEKFSSTETTKLAGEKSYLKTGSNARPSAARDRLNFALSLNSTQFSSSNYLSLTQLSSPREPVTLHQAVLRRETLLAQSAHGNAPPMLMHRAARSARESNEVLTIHERIAREFFSKTKLEIMRQWDVNAGRAGQFVSIARTAPQGHSRTYLTRNAQTLLTQVRATPSQTAARSSLAVLSARSPASASTDSLSTANAPGRDSITKVYLSPQSNLSALSKIIARTTRDRTAHEEKSAMPDSLERISKRISVFRIIRQEGREQRAPFERQFVLPASVKRFMRSEPLEFIRRALFVREAIEEERASENFEMNASPRTFASRRGMTKPETILPRGRGMLNASAARRLFGDERQNLERSLVALRQETKLELPQVAHVFAPPQRRLIEAPRAVSQVEEREVIETVKREIQTQMRSHSAVDNFTRADFTLITDQIYDGLARRLLMEKERLGLNA